MRATAGIAVRILGKEFLATKQCQEHIVRAWVLGMCLEDGALEILHLVCLPIDLADFGEDIGEGQALLRQPAVLLPVFEEAIANLFPRFGEGDAGGPGSGGLLGGEERTRTSVVVS